MRNKNEHILSNFTQNLRSFEALSFFMYFVILETLCVSMKFSDIIQILNINGE